MSDDLVRRRSPGLGRGLSALFGESAVEQPIAPQERRSEGVQLMAVSAITPHPSQPRRHFDEDALDELARSIEARGLVQPIVVRPNGDGYQIVAGERRWRAAQRARLHEVPVLIRELDEEQTLEISIIENVQRADLNAIEEAEAYQRLVRDYGHSADAVGGLVHKSRSHVANLLRLLELPPKVRDAVAEGRLTMGHARALITAPDAEALAQAVIDRGLSVRETESLARGAKPVSGRRTAKVSTDRTADADILALEQQLGELLGLKVTITHQGAAGTVTLGYSSLDQLDLICQRLSGESI